MPSHALLGMLTVGWSLGQPRVVPRASPRLHPPPWTSLNHCVLKTTSSSTLLWGNLKTTDKVINERIHIVGGWYPSLPFFSFGHIIQGIWTGRKITEFSLVLIWWPSKTPSHSEIVWTCWQSHGPSQWLGLSCPFWWCLEKDFTFL